MRIIVLLLALAMPVASAGSAPAIGFLADDDMGAASPGIIHLAWPETNESSARPVVLDMLGATCFQYIDEQPGTHFRGPLFAGLWPDAAVAKESELKVAVWVDGEEIAAQAIPLDLDPSQVPEPTSIVPPDPTNPDGALMQVVATAAPLILQPPTLVNFGYIDMELEDGAKIEVCLSLVSGDVPTAAAMALKYDGLLSPSYVYMPFWSADQYASPPQLGSAPSPSSPSGPYENSPPDYSGNAPASRPASEESPGIGFVGLLGVVALALLRRR